MEALTAILARLEHILTPPTSYTNDTVVFYPDSDDTSPEAAFKRELWEKYVAILECGKEFLTSQRSPIARYLSNSESDEIEIKLSQDTERRAFQEALHLAQTAENILHDPAP